MRKPNKIETERYNYIGVFLTFSCLRGCSYCLNESVDGSKKRSIVKGKKWVEGLNRIETDMPLTFNGGEPLLHPDFFSIVNGLKKSLKVDLLTTLPQDPQEFIRNLNPERFKRDLPYSAIRVTFHPETMNLEETISKVRAIKEAGFDISINLVDYPYQEQKTNRLRDMIQESGLNCVIKPFLGYLDGVFYGQFKYEDACSQRFRRNVHCRTSVLLIDSLGDIYRCHGDMLARNPQGLLGNIFKGELGVSRRYRTCTNFGHCHPCDVQTKFDRFGKWDYVAADIIGDGVVTVKNSKVDWR